MTKEEREQYIAAIRADQLNPNLEVEKAPFETLIVDGRIYRITPTGDWTMFTPASAREDAQLLLQAASEAGDGDKSMQMGLSITPDKRVALTTTEWTRCITMSGEGAIELGMMLVREGEKLTGVSHG